MRERLPVDCTPFANSSTSMHTCTCTWIYMFVYILEKSNKLKREELMHNLTKEELDLVALKKRKIILEIELLKLQVEKTRYEVEITKHAAEHLKDN